MSRKRKKQQQKKFHLESLEARQMFAADGFAPIEGMGNNVLNPAWGSTGEHFNRLTPPAYVVADEAISKADIDFFEGYGLGGNDIRRFESDIASSYAAGDEGQDVHVREATIQDIRGESGYDHSQLHIVPQQNSDGPIAFYTFDGDARDTSNDGTDNSGQLIGDAAVMKDAQQGMVLRLDGVGDGMKIANSTDINLATQAQRSIAFAFNADHNEGRQLLYEEGGTAKGVNAYLDGDELYVGTWTGRRNRSFLNLGTVQSGMWNNVAIVLDGTTGQVQGYLNGQLAASDGNARTLGRHGDAIGVGFVNSATRFHDGINKAGRLHFSGSIDNLGIYNRVLGSDEVADLADVPSAENQPPVAQDDTITAKPGTKVKLRPLLNDVDSDGDSLQITQITQGEKGKVGVNQKKGIIKYTAKPDATGTDSFTYTVSDGNGGTSTATVVVRLDGGVVEPENRGPVVASPLADRTIESGQHTINLSRVFSDADSDDLNYSVEVSNASLVSAVVRGDRLTLQVTDDQSGSADVTVTADDGNGGVITDTFTVTVDNQETNNQAPTVASPLPDRLIEENSQVPTIGLSSVFLDADGDALSYSVQVSNGSLLQATTNGANLTLQLARNQTGSSDVTLTAADGRGGSVSDTFTVVVMSDDDVAFLNEAEEASLRLLNELRVSLGLNEVTATRDISNHARSWAMDMYENGFRHSSNWGRFRTETRTQMGENIVWWSSNRLDPEEIAQRFHDMWINSPGHFRNMTNPAWTEVGVGLFRSSDRGWFGVHFFGNG